MANDEIPVYTVTINNLGPAVQAVTTGEQRETDRVEGPDSRQVREADREEARILVACMGNVLRGDDGFGVEVARELEEREFPPNVDVREVGISGVSMAQELLDGYDAMVLVDAMEREEPPGTLFVERAEVPDLDRYGTREIGSFAADMHQTDPTKVLVLGEALGVLPEPTILVGCEPLDTDDLEDSLSDPVREAVPRAVEHVETVVDELLADETD